MYRVVLGADSVARAAASLVVVAETSCGANVWGCRAVIGRGNVLGHVDLCDDARYFHGKPLLSFSATTTSPVVVIVFPQLVFLELRESNDRFAAYIEREITHHALQARHPVNSVAMQATARRTDIALPGCPVLVQPSHQASNDFAAVVPDGQTGRAPQRRRRSITGLQVENGRVVLAQAAMDVGSRYSRDVCDATFYNPLAAEAPF